jgi:NTP pyrophosphatase (non-canonical NTP hydrolase)
MPKGSFVTLDDLAREVRAFAEERNWPKYHTAKNLAMALAGEVGELVAEFQWLTPEEAKRENLSAEQLATISHEIGDVLIYLVRLGDVLGVDLLQAATEKVEINRGRTWPEG